jgi:hypothetical protein
MVFRLEFFVPPMLLLKVRVDFLPMFQNEGEPAVHLASEPIEAYAAEDLFSRRAVENFIHEYVEADAGAVANAKRDLEIAQECFSLDEEAWQRTNPPQGAQGRPSQAERHLLGQL